MNKGSSNLNLTINSKTWVKDTEDLFDFETDDTVSREFKLGSGDGSHYILSHNNKIIMLKDLSEVKKKVMEKNSTKILGEVICNRNGQFEIYNPYGTSKLQNFDKLYLDRLWMVLPKNVSKLVEEGDILKLGRVRLKIDKIVLRQNVSYETNYQNVTGLNYLKTNTTQPLANNNHNVGSIGLVNSSNNNLSYNTLSHGNINNNNLNNSFSNKDVSLNLYNGDKENKKSLFKEEFANLKEPQYICKICFRTESDIQDPLISPCKCSGSMGYIHYKCLKQCINMKINTKIGDNYMLFIWKNFECEICLSEYPKIIKYKNLTYNVVDLNITYEQYMILDYTLYDDSKKKSFRKGIIVVRITDNEEISIGRTQTNTIKLKDISVSRVHCYFTKQANKIYVADKGSKFGTLLYLNKPFTLTNEPSENRSNTYTDSSICLISGKNSFNFKLTQSWNFLANLFSSTLCCKCKAANEDEFVLNIDELIEENEITKIKELNHINLHNLLDDSYHDYVLNLETIIKCECTNNKNNSFI